MPILVKDYSWTETKESLHVTVPLKGVKASNVGLLCTNEFLKANYPPFLFETLLYKEVDDAKSGAKIREGSVEFNLVKLEPEIWGRLNSEHSEDKSYMLKKKLEAVEYVQQRTEKDAKEISATKNANKKYALKEMMKLEEGEKSRIESVKEFERKQAEIEMERWKELKQREEENEIKKLEEEKIDESIRNLENIEKTREATKKIFDDVAKDEILDEESVMSEKEVASLKPRGSQPRQGGKLTFKFTPRVFPTPLRESTTAEEDEWLKKQAEARQIQDVDEADLEEHEKDPVWLKEKGNKLFASGNYLAAVNAYNLAIRMQPKMHTLYLNRSVCHLKVRNFYKCIEDCSRALDLLQPPLPANASARMKAYVRKGTAFCELELYAEGLLDYNAAIKIDPTNEQLKRDAVNIKEIIEKGDGYAADVITRGTTIRVTPKCDCARGGLCALGAPCAIGAFGVFGALQCPRL